MVSPSTIPVISADNGIMEQETFVAWCERFWHDNPGQNGTTKAYRYDKIKCIREYASPWFKKLPVKAVTPDMIKQFLVHVAGLETRRYRLAAESGVPYAKNRYLSAGSIRLIRTAVAMPVRWAEEHGMLSSGGWASALRLSRSGSTKGQQYFRGMVCPRDIFTERELEKLAVSEWQDRRAYMMFLTARYTGMRLGELRALRVRNISPDYIDILSGYNSRDGLKCTKTGVARRFPIFRGLYDQLQDYLHSLPDGFISGGDSFVFPSFRCPGIPVGAAFASTALNVQMKKLGIPKERNEGGVLVTRTFHSLRHCMDTWLTSNTTLGLTCVSRLMGHSPQMVQHYSDHFNDEMYSAAAEKIAASALWPRQYRREPCQESAFVPLLQSGKNGNELLSMMRALYSQLGALLGPAAACGQTAQKPVAAKPADAAYEAASRQQTCRATVPYAVSSCAVPSRTAASCGAASRTAVSPSAVRSAVLRRTAGQRPAVQQAAVRPDAVRRSGIHGTLVQRTPPQRVFR